MTLTQLGRMTQRGRKGYAIVWRAIEGSFFTYRITFNNADEDQARIANAYGSRDTVRRVAGAWFNQQPITARARPAGFQFISANPRTIERESNDCVVRALSLAFNRPYAEVHAVCARAGRRPKCGMRDLTINKALVELSGNESAKLDRNVQAQTFTTFARDNPKGRYVIIKRGHAVALIDGVYHDVGTVGEPRAIVKAIYKVGV